MNDDYLGGPVGRLPIVRINEMSELYPEEITSPVGYRPKVAARFIKESSGDVALEGVATDIKGYEQILQLIDEVEISAIKARISLPSLDLTDYEQFYKSGVGRWLDFTPEAAHDLGREYVVGLMALADRLRSDGIDVEVVASGEHMNS